MFVLFVYIFFAKSELSCNISPSLISHTVFKLTSTFCSLQSTQIIFPDVVYEKIRFLQDCLKPKLLCYTLHKVQVYIC